MYSSFPSLLMPFSALGGRHSYLCYLDYGWTSSGLVGLVGLVESRQPTCAWLVLAGVFAWVLGLCDRSVCMSCRVEIWSSLPVLRSGWVGGGTHLLSYSCTRSTLLGTVLPVAPCRRPSRVRAAEFRRTHPPATAVHHFSISFLAARPTTVKCPG